MKTPAAAFAASLALALAACAADYHVAPAGNDRADGATPATAFKTLQRAADRVAAGDTVHVAPGVYFEQVRLKAAGRADAPIVFRAVRSGLGDTVVTGAVPALRTARERGASPWLPDPDGAGGHQTPHDGPAPARVLYDGVDLYPYQSLERLRAFMATDKHHGPKHGFFWNAETRTLHVRLHPDGKYGSEDPNRHVMAVSPETGRGSNGTGVRPHMKGAYTFGVLAGKGVAAHVVVDGFTFETPGVAGVYLDADDVTVRNCHFRGCRVGVLGRPPDAFGPTNDYAGYANRATVEFCDYTQFPAFSDAAEDYPARMREDPYQWQRKDGARGAGGRTDYETGMLGNVGRGWVLRHSRMWECFEALSAVGTRHADGLEVHDNLIQKVVDNAVEFEDHSRNVAVYRNIMEDVFQPISWQPLKGLPWPGPCYVYGNVFRRTKASEGLWRVDGRDYAAAFKLGASLKQWNSKTYGPRLEGVSKDRVDVPAPGLLIHNNTVDLPGYNLFQVIGGYDMVLGNVFLADNLLRVDSVLEPRGDAVPKGGPFGYDYRNNQILCPNANELAARVGTVAPGPGFSPGPSVGVPGALAAFATQGALQAGAPPLAEPVGPQLR